MQNRRSWEGGSQSELEDVCRRKVAVRSFIEAGWSTYAEQIILPSNRAAAAASSLQTVYDLAAKRRVGLRFNCKNLTSKCAGLRFTCNRQRLTLVDRKGLRILSVRSEPFQVDGTDSKSKRKRSSDTEQPKQAPVWVRITNRAALLSISVKT